MPAKAGFGLSSGFVSNGVGARSPSGYFLAARLRAQILLTFVTLMIILGARRRASRQGDRAWAYAHSPHQHSDYEYTDRPSVADCAAIFTGGSSLEQLWLFRMAPLVCGAFASEAYAALLAEPATPPQPAALTVARTHNIESRRV